MLTLQRFLSINSTSLLPVSNRGNVIVRNKLLLRLRQEALRILKFSTYAGVLKSEGAEPAHRCQTQLMSQKGKKKDSLFHLQLDDLLYVDVPVAPKIGSATETYYTSVHLKSDELDRQYMEEAKKRRMKQLQTQGKMAKVGAFILADYGEDGLVKGKIDQVSYYTAAEVSKMDNQKRRKIDMEERVNTTTNNLLKEVKAIHIAWGDDTVEWIELPDPDIEINPPFCPPERDNYAIPNLLDAIRPFATAPEYPTPQEMTKAGTELLPYQKRFLHWGLEREHFLKGKKDKEVVLDPRFTEIVLPDGKCLYIENEGTAVREEKATVTASFPGGILAEEMGLGKTVEIISLILAHPAPSDWLKDYSLGKNVLLDGYEVADCESSFRGKWTGSWEPCSILAVNKIKETFTVKIDSDNEIFRNIPKRFVRYNRQDKIKNSMQYIDDYLSFKAGENRDSMKNLYLPKVKATLVVVPVILVTQWKTELQRHAPHLKVAVMKPGETVDGWDEVCDEFRKYQRMLSDTQRYSVPVRNRPGYVAFNDALAMRHDLKYRTLKAQVESFWENSKGIIYKDHAFYDNLGDVDVCIVSFESFSYMGENIAHLPFFCNGTNFNPHQGYYRPWENRSTAPRSKPAPDLEDILYGKFKRNPGEETIKRQWWRVVLDEAQLVANYQSVRSEVAREIDTTKRWLVSGTPMNNTIEDLHGLLRCLGSNDVESTDVWKDMKTLRNEILIPFKNRQPVGLKRMKSLLASCIWRHSKSRVQEEIENSKFGKVGKCEFIDLRLDFSPQEQIWYDELHKSVKRFLVRQYHSRKNKNSATNNSNIKRLSLNPQTMRRLTELRQSCDHPQIVNRQHGVIGIGSVNCGRLPLQTIIKKMLRNSMSRQNVVGYEARLRYLKEVSVKYGVDVGNDDDNNNSSGSSSSSTTTTTTTDKNDISDNNIDVVNSDDDDNENDELSTCMICMDQPEVMVISKTCGHTACKDCIDHWLLEKCPFREKDDRYAMCPTCKQHLHASDLEEYSNTATIALKKNLTNNNVDAATIAEQLQASDNGTKINCVLKKMLEALQNDPSSKFVIFSQYNEMLDLTKSAIEANSVGIFKPVQFSTKDQKAQDNLNQFLLPYDSTEGNTNNNGSSSSSSTSSSSSSSSSNKGLKALKQKIIGRNYANILLLSMRSGGFSGAAGLTLTVANYCFILDPAWNPSLEDQAVARISRIGQKKKTTIYRLIVNNTVEDRVVEIANRKRTTGQNKNLDNSNGSTGGGLFANINNNNYTTDDVLRLFDLEWKDLERPRKKKDSNNNNENGANSSNYDGQMLVC